MFCFHKWVIIHKQPLYEYLECQKCGKRKVNDFTKTGGYGGYQPMEYPNWLNYDVKENDYE